MKGLREKFRKNSGFTLVEMLIVVAIIAILIMVSIPMMTNALEGSRHAVDQANIRDAIALGTIEYLTDTTEGAFESGKEYTYFVNENHQGKLSSEDSLAGFTPVTPQCKCNSFNDSLKVFVDKDGNVSVNWATKDNTGETMKNDSYSGGTTPP